MAKAAKKAATKTAPAAPKKAAAKKTEAPKKAAPKKAVAAPKKAAPKKAASKKVAAKKSGGQANSAFMAPLNLSKELADVIGSAPLPRTEIIKKIWDYIKKNNLQDKDNRRMINADDKLKKVFDKDQVSMFELAKIVNNHVK